MGTAGRELVTIERITDGSPWPKAVRVGELTFLSAHFGESPAGRVGDESGSRLLDDLEGRTAAQIRRMYEAIEQTLDEVGSSKSHILLMNGWFADYREWPVMNRVRSAYFEAGGLPVCTGFQAGHLPDGALAMAEALALDAQEPREVVGNPVQVGNYAPGSKAAGLIFLGGEVPGDSETGVVVEGIADLERVRLDPDAARTGVLGLDGWEGPIRAQTLFVYHRIAQSLAEGGSRLDRIVKQNVYLRDLRDYPAFERQSRAILGALPPTTVISADEYGHRGFNLEVEVVAATDDVEIQRSWEGGPAACGRDYPVAVHAGPLSFLSGFVPESEDAAGDGIELARREAHELYDSLERVLAAHGAELDAVVRQVLFVRRPEALAAVNEVALERIGQAAPATTLVGVREIVPRAAEVHLDITTASLLDAEGELR